jgi:Na+/proline symporter
VAYQYGISGPFWYGAGCSSMIVCFAYLGTVCKRRVPSAHTVLEIIKLRYGQYGLYFSGITTLMMLLRDFGSPELYLFGCG